jgi:hypothetical protein
MLQRLFRLVLVSVVILSCGRQAFGATKGSVTVTGAYNELVGINPARVKVDDDIQTSSTVGYVMKGTDRSLLTGAIVGKALGALSSGTGTVEVLATLQ